jgi:hypothetical protein
VTSTAETVWWSGEIAVLEPVTITIPVRISPTAAGRNVLNRATLDDGWGEVQPMEAVAWIEPQRVYLPLVFRQP